MKKQKTCVQCLQPMEYSVITECVIPVCDNPMCANFALLQVGCEGMILSKESKKKTKKAKKR